MSSIDQRLREKYRNYRWARLEMKWALLSAACFAALALINQVPVRETLLGILRLTAFLLGCGFLSLAVWRLRRYSIAPPVQLSSPPGTAIKGAQAFTLRDAALFSRLGRRHEVAQLVDWVVDVDKVPAIAVMGESGVGKTSLLRAGLAHALKALDQPVVLVYWEAQSNDAVSKLLRVIEKQFGTDDVGELPPSVIIIDQIEQLDPERDAELFSILRDRLQASPPFAATWIVALRREYSATWQEFLLSVDKSARHRVQLLPVHRFTMREAKEVLATLAEEAGVPTSETVAEAILNQIAEDGSVSPVDIGIALQVLHRQPEIAEMPGRFFSVGGHAGLLTYYLESILDVYPLVIREEVLRALLLLIDEDEVRRVSEGRSVQELLQDVRVATHSQVESALATLSQPAVRILEVINESPLTYRLVHERFIPAIQRVTGELASEVDRISRLVERRFQLWEREGRNSRFLLQGRELRSTLNYLGSLRLRGNREARLAFLAVSRLQRRRKRLLAVSATVLAVLAALAIGKIQDVHSSKRELLAWGMPERTYDILPIVTELKTPLFTDQGWFSRAVRLQKLDIQLGAWPNAKMGRLPRSLSDLAIDFSLSNVTELQSWPQALELLVVTLGSRSVLLPAWPRELKSLSLQARVPQELPEWPSSLERLALSGGAVSIVYPTFPRSLSELRIVGFNETDLARLPEWPLLSSLSLFLDGDISTTIELPVSLQRLAFNVNGTVGRLPQWPSRLEDLSLVVSEGQVQRLPAWPTLLKTLRLDMNLLPAEPLPPWPEYLESLALSVEKPDVILLPPWPPNLEQLHLNLAEVDAASLPTFPSRLRTLVITLGEEQSVQWPRKITALTVRFARPPSREFREWPETLEELNIVFDESPVGELPEWPQGLKRLRVTNLVRWGSEEWIDSLPPFPVGLESLDLDLAMGDIIQLPILPGNLARLKLSLQGAKVSSLPSLPDSLEVFFLDIRDTPIQNLPLWPSKLRRLALLVGRSDRPMFFESDDSPFLLRIEVFPDALEELTLVVDHEPLTPLPGWPSSLQRLNLVLIGAEVQRIPSLPPAIECASFMVSTNTVTALPESVPMVDVLALTVREINERYISVQREMRCIEGEFY